MSAQAAVRQFPICAHCHEEIDGKGRKYTGITIAGPVHYLHLHCWDTWCELRSRRERAETRRRDLLRAFESCMRDAPRWKWARFDNLEFQKRTSKKILKALEGYEPARAGNLVLSGRTGIGKTACCCAWQQRNLDRGFAQIERDEKPTDFVPFMFVSGLELAGARKRSGLGEEAPLVAACLTARVLFLDEVGFEPLSEELQLVLDARYRAEQRTIVTTGLSPAAFRDRYGDALLRRLIEQGAILEEK